MKITLMLIMILHWGYTKAQEVEPIETETGIYFDEIGIMRFYPIQWKVVSYINLEPTRNLWQSTKSHQKKVLDSCKKIENKKWYHLTNCAAFQNYINPKTRAIDNLKNLIGEYLADENLKRNRRGVLNFIGDISKILFGTLTQSDADEYNQHISALEKEQKEFLHISKEQMTVIKSTIGSVNLTIQRINENEQILKESMTNLANATVQGLTVIEEEVDSVLGINEQIGLIERGIEESQHSFELLLDAFIHAEQGTPQPQLITTERIRNIFRSQPLPQGLDYPDLSFSELQKITIPHTYAYKQFLVYVLEIPLLSPTHYHLYHNTPFPVKRDNIYVFINSEKEYIFSDSLRQHFGKLTSNELTRCFQPNELLFICPEDIPIYAYLKGADCEATMLHPSTKQTPQSCDLRVTKLTNTLWIPLHLSNQWLFAAPQEDTLTTLCGTENKHVNIKGRGKLSLKSNCKAFSSTVTLYALSKITTNLSNDFLPTIPIDYDCCFELNRKTDMHSIDLKIPLMNILTSNDELRLASLRVDEVNKLIEEQEKKDFSKWYVHISAWGTALTILGFLLSICCCCCCCSCCRNCFFWFWDKWAPSKCWQETTEKMCVNFYNMPGNSRVIYKRTPSSEIITLPPSQSPLDIESINRPIEEDTRMAQRTRSKTKVFR